VNQSENPGIRPRQNILHP